MAIQRPITKTLISTVGWGIPVTDEVNRLSAWQLANPRVPWGVIASATVTTSQSGIGASATPITGMAVTFTVVAGRLYQISAGGLILLSGGSGIADILITDSLGNQFAKMTQHLVGVQFWSPGTLQTPPRIFGVGPVTMQCRAMLSAFSMSTNGGPTQPQFMSVEDCGPSS